MNIEQWVGAWISAANCFDVETYLGFFTGDALLDDPSVCRKFVGLEGIREYFNAYFIGYNTFTELQKLRLYDESHLYLEVLFTGDFPEGKIGGSFDIQMKHQKIYCMKADLI
ncbi:nuclear transport factor 2 family protein [uncultured Chryseobacterium sp.]|uniref:nuclear transport factor 2 family protein n=1 Tax=uncultured Chryseobacterium sp. TaxID=259322 RepID=UPI0025887D33|nr:nuclear transport factor 2 family protein [uncultured Chryseobacterium sp.]